MCLSPQRCASYRCLVGFRFRPVLRHLSTLHTMHTLRNEMTTVKTSHLVKEKIICTVSTILETNTQRFIKEKNSTKKTVRVCTVGRRMSATAIGQWANQSHILI